MKQLLFLGIAAILWCISCNEVAEIGTYTDKRDQKTYRTKVFLGKIWMIDNLNFETDTSWCYENNSKNCEQYGRLYPWSQAMQACPEGWRLPTREEWMAFATANAGELWYEVDGGEQRLYEKLIEGGESGFEFNLPGLYDPEADIWFGKEEIGSFWSSDKFAYHAADCAVLDKRNGEIFMLNPGTRVVGHSCRCVKDIEN